MSPHSTDEWILDSGLRTEGAGKVVHVNGPDHGAAVVVLLDPIHLEADGSFIVEADPLISLDEIRHLHLIVPDIRCLARPEHLTDLWAETKQ